MNKSYTGSIERLLIKPKEEGAKSFAMESVDVEWAGFLGDKHSGDTMIASSRQKPYEKGSEIRNTRQISIVSTEEMQRIANELGVDKIEPEWVGANMLISGIENFTDLASGSRLHFENGVGLVIEGDNPPCTTAGKEIQEHHPEIEGITTGFPKRAIGKRGLVAWVERPGKLIRGETLFVKSP